MNWNKGKCEKKAICLIKGNEFESASEWARIHIYTEKKEPV